MLVVHYEARSDDSSVEAQFKAAIEEAAELAGKYGVILGIENIEVERTERASGVPGNAASPLGTDDL